MSIVSPDTSPADLLRRLQGLVSDARFTHSGRIQLVAVDAMGEVWRLVSWESDYAASDSAAPRGKVIAGADLDARSGTLTVGFADGAHFTLTPNQEDGDDDAIEAWELFTPDGLVLTYGPAGRWQMDSTGGSA